MTKPNKIDIYIDAFPDDVQKMLLDVRETIRKAAPDAQEIISYNMPAYKMKRILVYFAGYKNHIGFYPSSSGIEAFKSEFSSFKWAKGSVQFPLDKAIPFDLITKIVKFRVNEDLQRVKTRKK